MPRKSPINARTQWIARGANIPGYGVPGRPQSCAIANYLKDAYPEISYAWVDVNRITLTDEISGNQYTWTGTAIPQKVISWLLAWDDGVAPDWDVKFTLKVTDASDIKSREIRRRGTDASDASQARLYNGERERGPARPPRAGVRGRRATKEVS
jgi:hypothetical protein